jgi:RNA polymerase sigma factor (sigma-70 family)
VVTVAKRYLRFTAGTGITFSDILQEGTIGLQRAAEKYDPECGYKMSTYAYWWIRQAITRSIEMRTGIIHVPSGAKRKMQKFRDAAMDGGSIEEILGRAGLKQRDMHYIEQATICRRVENLDEMDLRSV